MKTFQIKLSKLQILISSQEIEFKNNIYKIDWVKLNDCVNYPKKNNINDIIGITDEELLYKQLALYILNNKDDGLIEIDLDGEKNIVSGNFEYIKSIFEKKKELNILINELTPNNKILIAANKLIEVTIHQKIKSELYLNLNLNDISNKLKELKNTNTSANFEMGVEKINKLTEYVNNENETPSQRYNEYKINEGLDEFINSFASEEKDKKWVDLLIEKINGNIFPFLYNGMSKWNLNIDLLSEQVINKAKVDMNNNNFTLAGLIIKENLEIMKYEKIENILDISNKENLIIIKNLLNNQKLLDFLIQHKKILIGGRSELEIENIYKFLNNDKKQNLDVINAYAKNITDNSSVVTKNGYDLSSSQLKEIPINFFKNKSFIEKFILNCSLIDIIETIKNEDNTWINPEDIKDILRNQKQDEAIFLYNISQAMLICIEKMNTVEKEKFIEECVELRIDLVKEERVFRNLDRVTKFLEKTEKSIFYSNKDILDYVLDFSMTNENIEKMKLNVWHNNDLRYELIEDVEREYKKKLNDQESKYIEYLQKPEFMCLMRFREKNSNTFYQEKVLKNTNIKKIKNADEMLNFVDNILYLEQHVFKDLEFTPRTLFKCINNELKNNLDFVLKYMKKTHFSNIEDLPEKLQFNAQIVLKSIDLNVKNLKTVESIFLQNEEFLLEVCKLLDKKKSPEMLEYVPKELKNIFDSQNITNEFEKNFKSCLDYIYLKENFNNEKEEKSIVKRKKI